MYSSSNGGRPALANIVRYGNVRGTDTAMVGDRAGLVTRICVGLPSACASLNDEAAQIAVKAIAEVHAAVALLQVQEMTSEWHRVLAHLADQLGMHGTIAGGARASCANRGVLNRTRRRPFQHGALARCDPAYSAAWSEGFLEGSGILLVNDESLWQIVDDWISGLNKSILRKQLPILRRTFATFHSPERRALVSAWAAVIKLTNNGPHTVRHQRAAKALRCWPAYWAWNTRTAKGAPNEHTTGASTTVAPDLGARQQRSRFFLCKAKDLAMDRRWTGFYGRSGEDRTAGLGASSPTIARWLGDIRSYFPAPWLRVMQQDAMDRLT